MLSSSSLAGPGNGYESLIVIASMSISGLMLAFSIAAIGYVFHKRWVFALHLISAAHKEGPARDDIAPLLHRSSPIREGRPLSGAIYIYICICMTRTGSRLLSAPLYSSRKQYRASSSTKSEYSLRTVAEQLDNNEPAGPAPQVHARPRTNGTNAAGSTYSLRKQVDPEPADVDDGECRTPLSPTFVRCPDKRPSLPSCKLFKSRSRLCKRSVC